MHKSPVSTMTTPNYANFESVETLNPAALDPLIFIGQLPPWSSFLFPQAWNLHKDEYSLKHAIVFFFSLGFWQGALNKKRPKPMMQKFLFYKSSPKPKYLQMQNWDRSKRGLLTLPSFLRSDSWSWTFGKKIKLVNLNSRLGSCVPLVEVL